MIILASKSPRRRELFSKIGLEFRAVESPYQEDMSLSLAPDLLAKFLAQKKAEALASQFPNDIIVGADTLVSCGGVIYGKPKDQADAIRMLKSYSGNSHEVITGYCIFQPASGKKVIRAVTTRVHFRDMSKEEISTYAATEEPYDKSGAYAVQGGAAPFVSLVEGDILNVVGLPVDDIMASLKEFGVL